VEQSQQSESKTSRKLQGKLGSSVLIFVGITIFVFGAYNYYKERILSFSKVPPQASQAVQSIDAPVEIIIPSVNIDLKVDPGTIKDGVWQISQKNATFLDTSAAPGGGGNVVIYGHNKKEIFGNLPFIGVGKKIMIKTKSGKIYNYLVEKKYIVSPDRVDLVSPMPTEQLTIYTCYGLFDSQRAVIVAKPQI
jgi:LPXTG-site transpeptidase (sortase) family protein